MARVVAPGIVAAAVVVIVVGAVARIGPASGPDRRTVNRSFAALVAPIVVQSNATGVTLNQLLAHGPTLERTSFFSDLASIASDAGEAARRLAAVTPPEPTDGAAASCGTAMDDRAHVTAQVRAALEGLLGGSDGRGGGNEASAARTLGSAGVALESADAAWSACRRSLKRAPGSARLPASTWVTDRGVWGDTAVGPFVASLVGSPSLVAVHRIAVVTVTTTPAAVPGGSGQSVVPATSSVLVQVVVADRGNVDEPGVKVVVTAVPQGSLVPARPPVQVTTSIGAGTSVALSLAPLRVRVGTSYVLDVTATPLAPGASVTASIALRVALPTPTSTTTTTTTTTTTPAKSTTTTVTSTKVRSG